MEFKASGKLVIEQRGKTVFFRVQDVSDPENFVVVKLDACQAADVATKLLFEAQKAVWYAG